MKSPSISVAMCTYNGSRFLRAQLESIAAQTKLPEELIVCDDGSKDETVAIIREFVQQVRFPVRLEVNTTNLGSTKNFEKAIRLCQGDVIVLSDQDDVWRPEKLRRTSEVLQRCENTGAVFSDAELIDANSKPLPRSLWASVFFKAGEQDMFGRNLGLRVMLKHPVVTGATMAFRSQFRELVLPIPSDQIHDHWIALLIASVSQLAPIREALIQYRKHDAQQIGPWVVDSLWHQVSVSRQMNRDYLEEAERFSDVHRRLCDRIEKFPPHPLALSLIPEKVSHQRTRGNHPGSKLLRLAYLAREVISLRYWRYSNGLGSLAKDLLV